MLRSGSISGAGQGPRPWNALTWAAVLAFALGGFLPIASSAEIVGGAGRIDERAPTSAEPPPGPATIRPGTHILYNGIPVDSRCTANFLFRSTTNGTLYLGAADHCLESLPLGSAITVGDAAMGRYAFSLPAALGFDIEDLHYATHDFALVEIREDFASSTSPAVVGYGGPKAIHADGYAEGDVLLAWGNSSYRPAVHSLRGVIYDSAPDFFLFVAMPGLIFGDSGSPVMSPDGFAVGHVLGPDLVLRTDYVLARTNEVGFSVELLTHESWNPLPL